MTSGSIFELAQALEANEDLHKDYLIRKLGFLPEVPEEAQQARNIMFYKGIITHDSYWPQLCFMMKNIIVEEYNYCFSQDPSAVHDMFLN